MYIVIIISRSFIIRIYFKSNNLLNTTFTFLAHKYNLLRILNFLIQTRNLIKKVIGGKRTCNSN